ncbi:uncharacterized protein LOC121876595 [Homarus americanus]|uniref:Insulin-like growth factor-binding protein complex acid labile subunit-like 4 n=1 Tax=Homarus americanus TaxID=6706 RepID=A0A8J5JSC2_HOMAM|nr:uncharacterized protein LOC121876595 [Homarus americanus]XP_042237736.1 uncharacterized protein LOC121876595 [Homarus americanus]KAG7160124.1 Insulin-like growth factor-binding protein complex acid labile subunit-like 4 [Homarus americanus]
MGKRNLLNLLCVFSVVVRGWAAPSELCPRECTCEDAPLKDASFVLTWMTSWGEDDLPEVHPNEVIEAGDMVTSTTAGEAGVDVNMVGLHVTCALMPETNLTTLFHAIPARAMVLTVLQATGSDLVVVEAGQLTPLKELKALHLQGYARHHASQVSGYFSNRVRQMVQHKEEVKKMEEEDDQDLLLAISEDALMPLTNLQLLDLQYVRLVAAMEGGRLRRQTDPLSTTTLLDMPLPYFLSLSDQIQDLDLPPELLSKLPPSPPAEQAYQEFEFVMLDDDEDNVVPYEVFKSETDIVLAPFMAQTQLRYLRVAHAKLDCVGPELLTGLSNLHTLTLEHNKIKILPPAMFTPSAHIRHLSLAHNNILALEGDSFTGLEKLLTLDLDYNKLDSLGPASFPRLPCLATLRLLGNPLTHIFPFTFANVNATENLLLGSSQVSAEIHIDTFKQLGSLTVLQLENTTLLSLSRALLEGMPDLKELTIHGHIPSIDFDAFTATPNLESLTLSNCHLARLSLDAFFGLKSLRFLDLSHNGLMELSPGTFDHLSSLRELYLHHNNLTTLPPGIFLPLPAKLVQLQENPWHCTCDLLQLRPAVTNKVRQTGYTTCRWEEKQGTVCTNNSPIRLRFDSRVAPLCATPLHHSRQDVHHVTSRRLKCPKHLWNPRPAPFRDTLRDTLRRLDDLNVNSLNERKAEVPLAEDEPTWLPLTAFSSPPHDMKDLLEIAESEMPEEAFAPLTDEYYEGTEGVKEDVGEEKHEEEDNLLIVQLTPDQAALSPGFSENNTTTTPLNSYRLEKQKLKAKLKADRERRLRARQAMKQQQKLKLLAEKRKIKAQMEAEQRRDQHRKEAEMREIMKEELLKQRMTARQSTLLS